MASQTRTFRFDDLAAAANLPRDPAAVRARLEMLERVMEGAIQIPGTQRRFGLDAVIGLIPVVGDVVGGLVGSYLIWEARNLGMSKWTQLRMAKNIAVDTALGAIPLVGDVFDLFYKATTKNMRLIRRHLDKHHPATVTVDAMPLR